MKDASYRLLWSVSCDEKVLVVWKNYFGGWENLHPRAGQGVKLSLNLGTLDPAVLVLAVAVLQHNPHFLADKSSFPRNIEMLEIWILSSVPP